jgi:hypothetical protein
MNGCGVIVIRGGVLLGRFSKPLVNLVQRLITGRRRLYSQELSNVTY